MWVWHGHPGTNRVAPAVRDVPRDAKGCTQGFSLVSRDEDVHAEAVRASRRKMVRRLWHQEITGAARTSKLRILRGQAQKERTGAERTSIARSLLVH